MHAPIDTDANQVSLEVRGWDLKDCWTLVAEGMDIVLL